MMKRVIIGLSGLIAIGGVALWWTDARAQCNGVGTGGSCKTGGLLGRSLVGITRTLDPGTTTFEFFGTVGPGCNHDFSAGVLDCDCRLRGAAYCIPDGSNGDDELVPKRQILPQAAPVITTQPIATFSPSGNSGSSDSWWTVAEAEPDPACVSCPAGTTFVTFIANRVVMRDTFIPDGEGTPHTTIRLCLGGGRLDPTTIESYDCQTVFECEGEACPVINTSGNCTATCNGNGN